MKILSIVGSPRVNGNTHFLAQTFCEGARSAGWESEEVILNQKKIHGCIHCDKCLETGVCAIEDDQAELIAKMRAADGYVLSTPVYCFSVTAQMKAFLDRSWSMCRPTWITGVEGKPVFFIVGAAGPPRQDPNYVLLHHLTFETMFRIAKAVKLVQRAPVKTAIDPMADFDATSDTLKLLYQVSGILGMEPVGFIAAESLGHDRDMIRNHRQEEVQNAAAAGAKFAFVGNMMKAKAFL
ncbi:MAG: flavodoxin family protein [Deltaproteobacteria bacterium]|nr:flavodoxin family protein [Deltaproteobacteria bacterium]